MKPSYILSKYTGAVIMFLVVLSTLSMAKGFNKAIPEMWEDKTALEYHTSVQQLPVPIEGYRTLIEKIGYPVTALKARVEGKVLTRVYVDESGNVQHIDFIKSLGFGCEEAIEQTLMKTHFIPGRVNDRDIKTMFVIPFEFKLSADE